MTKKETPRERMLQEEKRLENYTELGLRFNEDPGGINAPNIRRKLTGDTGFGTSRSPGARYAAGQQADKIWRKGNVTAVEAADDPSVRQARREAAAQEQREAARGMKKGGLVSASKRADGIAQRGRTKGRVV